MAQEESLRPVAVNAICSVPEPREFWIELVQWAVRFRERPSAAREDEQLFGQLFPNQAQKPPLCKADLFRSSVVEASVAAANTIWKVVKKHKAPPKCIVVVVAKVISNRREKRDFVSTRNDLGDAPSCSLDSIFVSVPQPMGISHDREALPVEAEIKV